MKSEDPIQDATHYEIAAQHNIFWSVRGLIKRMQSQLMAKWTLTKNIIILIITIIFPPRVVFQ